MSGSKETDPDAVIRDLLEAGKKMTARDHREQTITYVLASAHLDGAGNRKDVERCIDKIYGTETKP